MAKKENIEIYQKYRDQLLQSLLSNSENYDRSILTLSTAALGLSISVIRDFVPVSKMICESLLYISWSFYAVSILATILSFVSSQWGIKRQLLYAEKYYLEEIETYLKKKNVFRSATTVLNHISGFAFIVGIILTVIFVSANVSNIRRIKMVEEKKSSMRLNITRPSSQFRTNGAEIPQMSPGSDISSGKGAEIPAMQPSSSSDQGSNSGETQKK